MKSILMFLLLITMVFSCKNDAKNQSQINEKEALVYASFGDEIKADGAISATVMYKKYQDLKPGDTITSKLSANINEVCSKKGCWMKLDLGNQEEVMVRFKDYGFFMPLNAEGDVIIDGRAYVAETSVDELRHYAEDAGKSEEEIAAITKPKRTYAFEANGVLLRQ